MDFTLENLIAEAAPNAFTTCDVARPALLAACAEHPEVATHHPIGTSEAGRPLDAFVLGHGPRRVSLMAGAHSDEPVGPETLRSFVVQVTRHKEALRPLLQTFQFVVVPHINPDGEAENWTWMQAWPDAERYLEHVFREPPGRDLEFGFPNLRKENTHVSEFLLEHGPYALHLSLHGMAVAEGVLLLIERHWIERTAKLRRRFAEKARALNLPLHDHDRKGEKGFLYIEPGFSTTPEGAAMRRHFEQQGDPETARLFHDSSMEFVRKIGGDPLCLVTEIPLFLLGKDVPQKRPGVPQVYLEFMARVPELKLRLQRGASIADVLQAYHVRPVPLKTAMRLQLFAVQLGLESVHPENETTKEQP